MKKLSTEFVKEQIVKLGHEPLFDEYVNCRTKLLCKCKKHGEFYIKSDTLKRILEGKSSPNGNGCLECWREKQRHSIEEISNIFYSQDLTPLFKKYKNLRDRVPYICNKHPEEGIQYTEIQCVFAKNTVCKRCKSEKRSAWQTKYTKEELIEDKNARRCIFYFDWKKKVLRKNNHRCQKCSTNKKLIAHHIFNFKTHKSIRYDIDNGIILCEECHKKFHSTYGNKVNNDKQLNEFLGENQ